MVQVPVNAAGKKCTIKFLPLKSANPTSFFSVLKSLKSSALSPCFKAIIFNI
jgi:hypothetical protein